TPATPVPAGAGFTVEVEYHGVPEPIREPQLGTNGFHHTEDGAFAIGQPRSASTWFPVNDHPSDKATYAFEITVPEGLVAVANGVPAGRRTTQGWTTWRWREQAPMASYLATLAIGEYRVSESSHRGLAGTRRPRRPGGRHTPGRRGATGRGRAPGDGGPQPGRGGQARGGAGPARAGAGAGPLRPRQSPVGSGPRVYRAGLGGAQAD